MRVNPGIRTWSDRSGGSPRCALIALLLAAAMLAPAPEAVWGATGRRRMSRQHKQTLEKIDELKGQIDDLYRQLPPELQRKVRKKLEAYPDSGRPAGDMRRDSSGQATLGGRSSSSDSSDSSGTVLGIFDSSGDGKITRADAVFPSLYLWFDRNGDRRLARREVDSLRDRGVREIDGRGEVFVRARGTLGEMRLGERIVLDIDGDGFDRGGPGQRSDDAFLALDADSVREAGYRVLTASGSAVRGVRPIERGWTVVTADGNEHVLRW